MGCHIHCFKFFSLIIVLVFSGILSACTQLFFFPMKEHVSSPGYFKLPYEDHFISVANNTQLHGWFLPAQTPKPKGTVLFLHGNAENISTHIAAVYWLPAAGYQVFLYDYRGYGKSTGNVDLIDSIADVHQVIAYLLEKPEIKGHPFFILSQSLGSAIAVNAIQAKRYQGKVHGFIIDSGFSNFRKIAREKLALSRLLWLFQWPLSLTITGQHNPADLIAGVSPIPVLVIHGSKDNIIPFSHGLDIYAAAAAPKAFMLVKDGDHIQFSLHASLRRCLVEFLEKASSAANPPSATAPRVALSPTSM